ncbi:general secretion pathway protein H [Pseudomonas lurida]|jgi:general secretion pathway protein H|uniref:type II secretion system minor pseudopilin GspH n=1 Tax=Pseudomonas lurida TaxID=244566 RepID=UPI000BFA2E30|nr:type II secretion system minor pseudopilin GspH [Pseudomonas lurida]PFG25146.1 general secretion pathway protein H [Pseudomonas lurida]
MRKSMAGFTMLELLVVMIIIGLLASLVGLVQSDPSARNARREAERLQNLIGLLREDAALNNISHGLRLEPGHYGVLTLDHNGQWQTDKRFKEHSLPDELRLNLQDPQPQGRDTRPQLLVLANDQISPFSLLLEYRRQPLLSLSSDGIQEVQLAPVQ